MTGFFGGDGGSYTRVTTNILFAYFHAQSVLGTAQGEERTRILMTLFREFAVLGLNGPSLARLRVTPSIGSAGVGREDGR